MRYISLIFFSCFIFLENQFPLRRRKERVLERTIQNLGLAVFNLPFNWFFTYPFIVYQAHYVKISHFGLLNQLHLNSVAKNILSFFLLDYLIYWWHVFNHRVHFLWRFHQVHHVDKDMDASTALRFHIGELLFSVLFRMLTLFVFGFDREIILFFDILVTSCALFHHSNLKLPVRFEKLLLKVIVTPLYHQNHHSYFQEETDSNYGAILTFWDRLHKSHSHELNPENIIIGFPAHEERMSFAQALVLPFKKLKAWPVRFIKRS